MRRLVKNMSVYGLGGILNRAVQFLLLPVYTRVLSPEEYGSLELVYLAGSVAAILFGLMISSGYVRVYFERPEQPARDRLLGSALFFTFSVSLLVGGGIIAFAQPLANAVFDFSGGAKYIVLIAISDALSAHSRVLYNVLMVQERATRYVLTNVTTVTLSLSLIVLFVVGFGWSVEGVLIGQLIAYAIEVIVLSVAVIRRPIFTWSRADIREMLSFSAPLLPLQMAAFVLSLADRWFLQHVRTVADVGLYALGVKFATVIPLLTVEPFKAFGPYIFSLVDQPERCKKVLADTVRFYVVGALTVALSISVLAPEIIRLVADPEYRGSSVVVLPLALGQVCYGLFNVTTYGINIVKKNWYITGSWFFSAVANIILNATLAQRYGMVGASIATASAYLIAATLNIVFLQRVYPIVVPWRAILGTFLWCGLMALVAEQVTGSLTLRVLAKVGLLAVFVLGVLAMRAVTITELRKFKAAVSDWRKKSAKPVVAEENSTA